MLGPLSRGGGDAHTHPRVQLRHRPGGPGESCIGGPGGVQWLRPLKAEGDPMPSIQGGCLCGAIRYTSDSQPAMVALCHCTHCQRQSGAAFSVNVGVPKGTLRFTAGKTRVFTDTGSSGQPVYRHFCGDCGSPIFSDVAASPQLDWLKAGTLDDSSWVQPAVSIWCASAQGWVPHPAGVPQFPQNPPG